MLGRASGQEPECVGVPTGSEAAAASAEVASLNLRRPTGQSRAKMAETDDAGRSAARSLDAHAAQGAPERHAGRARGAHRNERAAVRRSAVGRRPKAVG